MLIICIFNFSVNMYNNTLNVSLLFELLSLNLKYFINNLKIHPYALSLLNI